MKLIPKNLDKVMTKIALGFDVQKVIDQSFTEKNPDWIKQIKKKLDKLE